MVRFLDYGEPDRPLGAFQVAAEGVIPRTGEVVTLQETRYTVVKVEHVYTSLVSGEDRVEIEIYLELRA